MKEMKDLSDLIAINSIYGSPAKNAPFGSANRLALDTFLSIARSYGLRVADDEGYAGWAEYGEGEKLVGVLGHLDIVPAGDGWESDPFQLTVREGNMYGRGVSDDKGPLFACLLALKRIKDEDLDLGARVRIIAGCNEESGSECIKHYVKNQELPTVAFTPDSDFPIIASEKGILHVEAVLPFCEQKISFIRGGQRPNIVPSEAECKIGDKSLFEKIKESAVSNDFSFRCGKITAHGKSAHGSLPERGDNAVGKLIKLLASFVSDPAIVWASKYVSGADSAEKLGIAIEDESGKLTLNLGMCDIKRDSASFVLDLRLPASADAEEIINKIKSTLPSGGKIKILHSSNALCFDENDRLITTLMRVYREVTGDVKSKPLHIGGGTYAKELPNCVAFGAVFPDTDTRMHEPNEYYPIADFEKLIEIYYKAMIALAREF